MIQKCVQPANTHSIAHVADYYGYTFHGDGMWSIMVKEGMYRPPDGWKIDSVNQLSTGALVRVQREEQ